MMETDDCRRHAAECERLARITDDPATKKELLRFGSSMAPDGGIGFIQGDSDGTEHSANKPN